MQVTVMGIRTKSSVSTKCHMCFTDQWTLLLMISNFHLNSQIIMDSQESKVGNFINLKEKSYKILVTVFTQLIQLNIKYMKTTSTDSN
jgi:hypothetical protein